MADVSKINELFRSKLVVLNVGRNPLPPLWKNRDKDTVQVNWKPVAGGGPRDAEAAAHYGILDRVFGGLDMKILVCNAGSTSLKFKFYEMPECKLYAQGACERVGSADDAVFHYRNVISGGSADLEKQCIPGYREGIEMFFSI